MYTDRPVSGYGRVVWTLGGRLAAILKQKIKRYPKKINKEIFKEIIVVRNEPFTN